MNQEPFPISAVTFALTHSHARGATDVPLIAWPG